MVKLTRRALILATSASVAMPWVARGAAPEFRFKFGNIVGADHPLNVHMQKVADKVAKETDGKVEIAVYPKNQLGSDADMLSQLRSGALELFGQSGVLLSTLVPVSSISGTGFAFPDSDKVWQAMDGALGKHIRTAFEKVNLYAFERCWDHGFRHTLSVTKAIKTPDDFKGFKIRVPPSPLWTSMFKAFGAAPVAIPWAETYSALQTRIADGLEQPLVGVYVDKMFEVGKYLSETGHMWDGLWVLTNPKVWDKLPPNLREIVERNINDGALLQRPAVAKMNGELEAELKSKGLQFITVNRDEFRAKLKESGYYLEWQKRYGDGAWSLLEATSGKLT
jgi:TRAP-type transport system periplasmic protein